MLFGSWFQGIFPSLDGCWLVGWMVSFGVRSLSLNRLRRRKEEKRKKDSTISKGHKTKKKREKIPILVIVEKLFFSFYVVRK